uniref:Prefoldin subunit 5 n=1 Tax=Cuerna arida TaxID=1464854 RepID=A0A1B6F4P2_9HEMI
MQVIPSIDFCHQISIKMATAEEPQGVDLSKLNFQQLIQLKIQVDNELNLLQDSMCSLKIAMNKFLDSKESLEKILPEWKSKEIMLPLTSSVYTPARINDIGNVLLDIGTGYFIQKDLEGAKDYFERKMVFINDQIEKIQAVGLEKSKIREVLVDVIETKLGQMAVSFPQGELKFPNT